MSRFSVVCLLMFTISFVAKGQSILAEVDRNYSGVKDLEVKGGFCSVRIIGSDSDEVRLNGKIEANKSMNGFAIHHEKQGDLLKVWVETPQMSWGNVRGNLELTVPKNNNVFIDNASGSVNITNIQYGGLVIESASGSVKLNNIISNSRISTASGSIYIEKHDGNIEAKSSSGSIKLIDVEGDISGRSSSGSINLSNANGDVDVESTSGSIHLSDIQGTLNVKSTSGSIHGSSVLLTGSSSFRSSSGSINMDLMNDADKLGFDLSVASGSIHINGERRDKSYYKSNNGIMIKGSSASGSQRYSSRNNRS